MPTRPDEATRTESDEGSKDVIRDVQEIGKASGAAIGWGELSFWLCFALNSPDSVQYLMRYRSPLPLVRTPFAFTVFLGTRASISICNGGRLQRPKSTGRLLILCYLLSLFLE